MWGKLFWVPRFVEAADPGAKQTGPHEPTDSTQHMHDAAACEVFVVLEHQPAVGVPAPVDYHRLYEHGAHSRHQDLRPHVAAFSK